MDKKVYFKKVVRLISIPLILIVLSLYLPDVYACSQMQYVDLNELMASVQCLHMVSAMQQLMMISATAFTIIIFCAEFYQFKHSYDKKSQQAGNAD